MWVSDITVCTAVRGHSPRGFGYWRLLGLSWKVRGLFSFDRSMMVFLELCGLGGLDLRFGIGWSTLVGDGGDGGRDSRA